MIIGTDEALAELGKQLLAAQSRGADKSEDTWPQLVAQPAVASPYRDVSEFKLTFHVLGTSPLPDSLRKPTRRGPPGAIVLAVLGLALVGAAAIIKSIL